jgi:hypothetical protein
MKLAAIVLIAGCTHPLWTWGQFPSENRAKCPVSAEITRADLLGLWRATFEGLAQGATLLLEPHPELSESVRGAINRDGDRALVAGDVDDGEFTLEESTDGVGISATWSGTVIDGSCGREIRGDWQGSRNPSPRAFVLRKQGD